MEDLWAFNEEEVARAIFNCRIPIISAVGHETDFTIADYVADLRAPTPSAAAELAVYDIRLVQNAMKEYQLRMSRAYMQKCQILRLKLRQYETRVKAQHPRYKMQEQKQRTMELEEKLRMLMDGRVSDARHRLALFMEAMKGLSPIRKLNQGYSFVQDPEGRPVKSTAQVRKGGQLTVYVSDGRILAAVTGIEEETYEG